MSAPSSVPIESIRHSYESTSVLTSAWTELVATLPEQANAMEIFDSSGQTMVLGEGPAGSESDLLYVPPGGNIERVPCQLGKNARISVKALSATADCGEIMINFYG